MSAQTGERPAKQPCSERLVGVVALFCLVVCAACMAFCVTGPWGGLGLLGRRTGLYPRSFAVTLGDLDGDSDLDAFVANGHTDDLGKANTVWLNNGRGRFRDSGQRLGSYTSDSRAVALGDVDGDGDLDAFVGNDGPNEVWLNDGIGAFSYGLQELGDGRTHRVFLDDLDGDGDLDALAANRTTAQVWLNDGEGRFTDSGQAILYSYRDAVTLGDLDGDGDVLAMRYGRGYQTWHNDGVGHFDLQRPRGRAFYWLAGGVPVTIAAGLFIWRAIQRWRISFATDKH